MAALVAALPRIIIDLLICTLIHGSDCLGRNLRIAIGVKVDDLWVGRPAFCAITH